MAEVRTLVLTHLSPMSSDDEIIAESRAEFAGEIIVARDLMTVEC